MENLEGGLWAELWEQLHHPLWWLSTVAIPLAIALLTILIQNKGSRSTKSNEEAQKSAQGAEKESQIETPRIVAVITSIHGGLCAISAIVYMALEWTKFLADDNKVFEVIGVGFLVFYIIGIGISTTLGSIILVCSFIVMFAGVIKPLWDAGTLDPDAFTGAYLNASSASALGTFVVILFLSVIGFKIMPDDEPKKKPPSTPTSPRA